ncbi:hypothetical protein niasHT_025313 [Heterodera trifolii]|uniref:Uncharacterized protein n=1 Tax=Heterodera trifolii TaxID=157864 RepID=A0ABD2KKJ7_9BILA
MSTIFPPFPFVAIFLFALFANSANAWKKEANSVESVDGHTKAFMDLIRFILPMEEPEGSEEREAAKAETEEEGAEEAGKIARGTMIDDVMRRKRSNALGAKTLTRT